MKVTLDERLKSYAERARGSVGVVLYVDLDKDGVRCCEANARRFALLANLQHVGQVDIAGVYHVDQRHPPAVVTALMRRDLKEIGVVD